MDSSGNKHAYIGDLNPEEGTDLIETVEPKNTNGTNDTIVDDNAIKTVEKKCGFIRLVSSDGNIYEGSFTPDFIKNGFCFEYLGIWDRVHVGWYKNDKRHGNWMAFNPKDMSILESGCYNEDQKVNE